MVRRAMEWLTRCPGRRSAEPQVVLKSHQLRSQASRNRNKGAEHSGKVRVGVHITSLRQKNPSAWPLGATHSIPRRRIRERNVSFSNHCFVRCVSKASMM